MSDAVLLLTAVAVVVAAWLAVPVPVGVGAGCCVVAWRLRRPLVWSCALAVLASGLGHAAWDAVAPTAPGHVSAWFAVRTDPAAQPGMVRFEVVEADGEGRRFDAWVGGSSRAVGNELQAGDEVWLEGEVEPRPATGADRLARRHVVGRLTVARIGDGRFATGLSGAANRVRRLLGIGTLSMSPDQRGLFGGFVLGDDRLQRPELTDSFRAAGLSHLLVVSGQNVAFVLLLARPALQWLGIRGRLAGTLMVLWAFAIATRFEPSVLRATVMAAVAATAWAAARPLPGRRVLALSVIGLVLADPLIAGSLGFLLSASASAGIALLARPLQARLPGPVLLREALAVTIAAQVAVAPLLAPLSDGIPVASLPANLLAVPLAGPLMAWGLTLGVVSGIAVEAGHPLVAQLLHVPSRAALWWIQSVAERAAAAPLGRVGAVAIAIALVGIWGAYQLRSRAVSMAIVAAALIPIVPAMRPTGPPDHGTFAEGDVRAWATRDPSGAPVQVVVVSGRSTELDVLRLARRVPLTRVEVVATSVAPAASRAVATLADRATVVSVWAPAALESLPDAPVRIVTQALTARVGGLAVDFEVVATRLVVRVTDGAASRDEAVGVASARGPPRSRADHRVARARRARRAVAG